MYSGGGEKRPEIDQKKKNMYIYYPGAINSNTPRTVKVSCSDTAIPRCDGGNFGGGVFEFLIDICILSKLVR